MFSFSGAARVDPRAVRTPALPEEGRRRRGSFRSPEAEAGHGAVGVWPRLQARRGQGQGEGPGNVCRPGERYRPRTAQGRARGGRRTPRKGAVGPRPPEGDRTSGRVDQKRNSSPRSSPWAQKLAFSNRGAGRSGPLTGVVTGGSRFGFTVRSTCCPARATWSQY